MKRWSNGKIFRVSSAALLMITLVFAPVFGPSSSRTWNISGGCTLGSYTYRFYIDGSNYFACNGRTGLNDFSSPDFVSLVGSALVASSSSGRYLFEGGTYSVSGGLFGSGSLTNLFLQGVPGSTIFQLTPGTARPMINLAANPMINVTFSGITFDGNAANQADATNIQLLVLTNPGNQHDVLDNIVCRDNRNGACIDFNGTDMTIMNSKFLYNNSNYDASAIGSDHVHVGHATNLRVLNNYFKWCTDTSLALDSVAFVVVSGNTFIDCKLALMTITSFGGGFGGTRTSTNITVTGNTYAQTLYDNAPAIDVKLGSDVGAANPGAKGVTITGNTFLNTRPTAQTQAEVFLTNAQGITFSNNVLQMMTTNTNSYIMQILTVHGLSMMGNSFFNINTGNAGKDILFSGQTDFVVVGNVFRVASFGIQVGSVVSNVGTISYNTFETVAQPFIFTPPYATTSVEIAHNAGIPISTLHLATAFTSTPCGICTFGLWNGTAATPTASTIYTAIGSGMIVSSTGGTGVSLSILNPGGGTVASGLTTLTAQYIPWRYQINFGAFSVAPVVTVDLAS